MPDRATIAAATPMCQAETHGFSGGRPQHRLCDKYLHWDHKHEAWKCPDPKHGFAGHGALSERHEANA